MLQLDDHGSIVEFFTKLVKVTNQMKSCGETISDIMKINNVLRILNSINDHNVMELEESKDIGHMKIEFLKDICKHMN